MAKGERASARPKRSRIEARGSDAQVISQEDFGWPTELPVRTTYLPHVLSRLMNLLNLQLSSHLRARKLTVGQFRVLQFVEQSDGATISQISSDCVIEQSVVSRMVAQLEHRKLVVRKKNSSNARFVQVFMTKRGQDVFAEVDDVAKDISANAQSGLADHERQHLLDLLHRVFRKQSSTMNAKLS